MHKKKSSTARPTVRDVSGDDSGAAELARRVADGLRRFRMARHLSLDELSVRSGVSRAALSQIEGAKTNPTIGVLWKIAVGLEIPLEDLLGVRGEDQVHVLRAGDAPPLRSADGRMETLLLSPGGTTSDVEVFEIRLQGKTAHVSEAHARGTSEIVVVLTGKLLLQVDGIPYELQAGDSAYFRADVEHSYENRGAREMRFMNVIRYERTS